MLYRLDGICLSESDGSDPCGAACETTGSENRTAPKAAAITKHGAPRQIRLHRDTRAAAVISVISIHVGHGRVPLNR